MNEKELFSNYELDNSSWHKAIYSLLAGSIIFHIIILLFLVYVPAVRDAFYIALLFSDAPTGWESKDYNKTKIEEGETISIISLPPIDQLQYPAGYFNLANGDAPAPDLIASTTPNVPEATVSDDGSIPGFPGMKFEQPTIVPTPLPDSIPPGFNSIPQSKFKLRKLPKLPSIKKGAEAPAFEDANGKNNEAQETQPNSTTDQTEPKKDATAAASPSPTPNSAGANSDKKLNQEPWKKIGAKAVQLINDKKLDLSQPINVTIAGELGKDGKFVGSPKIDPNAKADPVMKDIISDFVAALNDSGMLTYIKELNDGTTKRNVLFNIQKDEKQISVQLVTDVGSTERAGKIQSSLNFGFEILKLAKKGSEEGEMLDKVELSSDKGQVLINWTMPTVDALKRIQEKLAKLKDEQKPVSQSANPNLQIAVK